MFSLLFHMRLEMSHQLLQGRLILLEDGKYVDTYLATSGLRELQGKNDQDNSGTGPLPSCLELGGVTYTVDSKPLSMPKVVGVNGNFYKINPHLVSIWGRQRGDFGIHWDGNTPGSAGCIVLNSEKGWNAFQQKMSAIAKVQSTLNLVVTYS